MGLFYIRHHFQSIIRSKSFGGEVFAFFLVLGAFASSGLISYRKLDLYAASLSDFFDRPSADFTLFLGVYLLFDLAAKLIFRRPFPKLKYYAFLGDQSHAISFQYLFTSLFGIIPFVLTISAFTVGMKGMEWLGPSGFWVLVMWYFANHFLALTAQFGARWVKSVIIGFMILLPVAFYWFPGLGIDSFILHPLVASLALITSIGLSYRIVRSTVASREAYVVRSQLGMLENLPVFHFKNPIFQLEWALLARNRRTRSNLLLGLVSVLILPFLMRGEEPMMLVTAIYFIATGFFIIQHGVYSLGWEGSYFDFLICNISPKQFIRTRYTFYMVTCTVGLLLASVSTLILGHDWLSLFCVFLYNIGVTIPLVLYRSSLNDTKIVLTENSFMNYNGMMTGPIFVTSFLVILIPLILFGVAEAFAGEGAVWVLGAVGLVGLAFSKALSNQIAVIYQRRKYHLSQSFKA